MKKNSKKNSKGLSLSFNFRLLMRKKIKGTFPRQAELFSQKFCKNNSFSFEIILNIAQGRGRRLVKFSYQNHPTKVDVASGQIGAQQSVSAKSNDGVRVGHDFFGFLSHQYQEL